jgi:hypothetical protein
MSNFPAMETMAAMLTAVAAAMAATSALRQSNRRARKRGCGQEQNGCGEAAEFPHRMKSEADENQKRANSRH